MIQSFVFNDGKLAACNLDSDALRLVRADKGLLIWVNLFAPTAEETKAILEDVFSFHPLAIEDCLSISRYPKIEDYEDYLFLVMHAVAFSKEEQFRTTELDFFIGKSFLVTHHSEPLSMVTNTIERLQKNPATISRGMDRLAHFLLDTMVDAYQPVLNDLTKEISTLEDSVFLSQRAEPTVIRDFRERKKELSDLQQIVRPQRDVVNRLARGEFKLIRPMLLPYFRDLLNNINRIESTASTLSEQLYLTLDVFLNKASYETNEVIKVLTLMTAIITPTVVIGTWYEQVFKNMPGYDLHDVLWVALAATFVLTVGLVVWLKRKHWL
ncbi:MAG: magnesium transporter CorA family protein [Methylacidiphilales bacterium]|nr:magnesium transporter CorA family protein [Candidatus Methylacidiphilales bacterium]